MPNCRRRALKGKKRCRYHGGLARKLRPGEGAENAERMKAGRKKWVERMWALKNAGLIDRFPGGPKKGYMPPVNTMRWGTPPSAPPPPPEPEQPRDAIEYTRENALAAIAVLREVLLG